MKVSQIVVEAIDNKTSGNAIFKSRIDFVGSTGFNCELTYSHLSMYANNGLPIKLKVLDGGSWREISLDLTTDSMANVEDFQKSNSYGNS